jgi:ferredoxin
LSRSTAIHATLMKLWPLSKAAFWLGKQPVLGRLLQPVFNANKNHAVIIPVNEAILPTSSQVLPYHLLQPLIEGASARFKMDKCMCRENEGCQNYPHEIGCLSLGEAAARINPALGTQLGVKDALSHMEQAMQRGLVPLIAHTTFDAYLLGIPYRRMLTVCFCCDCCCVVRHGLHKGPPAFWDIVNRLPGLTVEVGEECVACGMCLKACPVGAIQIEDGLAFITEQCKGCGRCVEVCPVEAVRMRVAPEIDVFDHLQRRISEYTNIN